LAEFGRTLKQRHPDADAWWNWTDDYLAALSPLGHGYRGDKKRVYRHFTQTQCVYPFGAGFGADAPCHLVLAGADPATFQPINAYYGKDRNRVYHLARPIEADPETFHAIEGAYAADRRGIWFNGYLCVEADVASFEVLNWSSDDTNSFARDKATLFSAIGSSRIGKFKGYSTLLKPIKNSHPASFVRLNDIWAKEDHNVYCYGKVWPGIDAGSFEFLFTDPAFTSRSYAKCRNGLYDANGRKRVKGIDGATFQMLNSFWGKDQNSVYSFKTDRIQKRMDAATFEVTDDAGGARDKDFDYSLDSLNSVVRKKRKA
jgi:hypothetical protein